MRITFLGTGSAMPTGDRFQTGILLSTADQSILLDCGSGVLHRLAETEPGYEGISTVLLTHHHIDHVADLMPLFKARWLSGADHLEVVGPVGTKELLDNLFEVHSYMQDRIDLSVREVGQEDFSIGPINVTSYETRHSLPCLAYRFDNRFAFSGDSEAFSGLARFLDGCRVVAHDCSFPDDVDVSNHPTPKILGQVLENTDIGTLMLTHLYPHTEGRHPEMRSSLRRHYDGEVRFAYDGLTIEVPAD